MDAITTSGLCKRYGDKNVVNNLSITVPVGSVYGFIGRNGAGKSTTQKMVCGLIRPTDGDVRLFDQPVTDPIVRARVGTLIEDPGIYPGMSALDNVIMQGYNIGLDKPKQQAIDALTTVGLAEAMGKKAKHLSLGMRQRLGLAIAMLGDPQLLILDEPINGLDPEGIAHLRMVIESLHRDRGVTVFISSHILGELSKIATNYGIIKDGMLVEEITAQDLASKRKDYLHLRVDDANHALRSLREQLNATQYDLVSDHELHLYDITDAAAVNRVLSADGLTVSELYLHEQGLEEYFLDLMGGQDHA